MSMECPLEGLYWAEGHHRFSAFGDDQVSTIVASVWPGTIVGVFPHACGDLRHILLADLSFRTSVLPAKSNPVSFESPSSQTSDIHYGASSPQCSSTNMSPILFGIVHHDADAATLSRVKR